MAICENGTQGCIAMEGHYPSECEVPENWIRENPPLKPTLKDFLNAGVEYITREYFCELLGVKEKSYLEGRSRGKYVFPEHRLGSHVFLRRSEILASMGGDAE